MIEGLTAPPERHGRVAIERKRITPSAVAASEARLLRRDPGAPLPLRTVRSLVSGQDSEPVLVRRGPRDETFSKGEVPIELEVHDFPGS